MQVTLNPLLDVLLYVALASLFVLPNLACAQQEEELSKPVRSTLEGRLTIRTEIDESTDYRDFEVLVAADNEGEPDTLGLGTTDSTGYYFLDIAAPERNIYSLVISRRGQILTVGQLVVAQGDSATLNAAFPLGNRRFRVRSQENSALQAYQNTLLQHNQQLVELIRAEVYDEEAVRLRVAQTAVILWSMQDTFPGTMGGEAAMAEAIMLQAGWNDSLVVSRAQEVPPDNADFGQVGRIARQATARLEGHQAALAVLDDFAQRAVNDEDRALLASERVVAHMDSSELSAALAAAAAMQQEYADSPWAEWAGRVTYDIKYLQPGMPAPDFDLRTVDGDSLHLENLRGRNVILEFYRPEDDVYQRELEGRRQLVVNLGSDKLALVSISLQPDTLINEALFEERDIPGLHVYGGEEVARSYNVNLLPTRFLIDPEGRLVDKYVGGAMAALYEFMMDQ